MCVSAVLETDFAALEGLLRVSHLSDRLASDAPSLPYRIEPEQLALVVRQGAAGKLVAEHMRYKSYVIKRDHIAGDMYADSMLTQSHGLIAVKVFSEWVSTQRLLQMRVLAPHEVNCAFNRFSSAYRQSFGPEGGQAGDARMVLANFSPRMQKYLLVPVLFSPPSAKEPLEPCDFVVVSEEPPESLADLGGRLAPVMLTREAAHAWLATTDTDGADSVDFLEVLADSVDESFDLALFKCA